MTTEPDRTPRAGLFGPTIYAAWRDSSLGDIVETLEHDLLLRLTGPLRDRQVLDVGCGDGTFARLCAAQDAARVTGCDLDQRMVDRARAGGGTVELCVADVRNLPFPDNAFDVVTCVTVLTFLPDAGIAVKEMARVLRPGGALVIGDLGKWSVWAARRRMRSWFGAPMWRAATFRTARDIAALADQAGLRSRSINGAIFFPPSTWLARLMAPLDPLLGRTMTIGAAFVAVQAEKRRAVDHARG